MHGRQSLLLSVDAAFAGCNDGAVVRQRLAPGTQRLGLRQGLKWPPSGDVQLDCNNPEIIRRARRESAPLRRRRRQRVAARTLGERAHSPIAPSRDLPQLSDRVPCSRQQQQQRRDLSHLPGGTPRPGNGGNGSQPLAVAEARQQGAPQVAQPSQARRQGPAARQGRARRQAGRLPCWQGSPRPRQVWAGAPVAARQGRRPASGGSRAVTGLPSYLPSCLPLQARRRPQA